MSLYGDYFRDKVICSPCDYYEDSQFCKYFVDNYEKLGYSKFISSSMSESEHFDMYEYDGKLIKKAIEGTGDFRSDAVKKIIEKSDVIVTNPPFSLSKEFMLLLIGLKKDFIILGNINSITYKGIFSRIVRHDIFLGGSIHSGDRKFFIPDDYPLEGTSCGTDEKNRRYIRVKGVRWFTNVKYTYPDIKHTVLNMKYDSSYYLKFATYDAINVNSMKEIPYDYKGVMGVPITSIDKMDIDGNIQYITENGDILKYRLIGQLNGGNNRDNYDFAKPIVNGKCKFKRILIEKC